MEPYGPTIEDIFHQSGRYMSMHVLLGLADQLLSRVEFIHNRKVIHGNLTPWSFALGVGWQSQQLLLTDFNIEEQPKTISDDLRAIHKILAYLHSGAQDWESFNPDLVSVPVLDLFCRAIASRSDSVDYNALHSIFQEAYQDMASNLAIALGLIGPRAVGCGLSPNTSALSMLTSGELFDQLEQALAETGSLFAQTTEHAFILDSFQTTEYAVILHSFQDILDIYFVLLVRDQPSSKKKQYLMGAYHLPNRLWRDIRWFLNVTSGAVYVALVQHAYRFMTALYEVKHVYRLYWTKYLLQLARARREVEPPCGIASWTQTIFYWQDLVNKLDAESTIRSKSGRDLLN
jgi:hypothetical protein